jgi:ribosomal protein L23
MNERIITIEEIEGAINILDIVRKEAIMNSKYGFDDDWIIFNKKMRILTTQSSGGRIQDYIFRKLGWIRVSSKLDRGDVKNSLGQYFEVKVTTITTSNTTANVIQIRLWQKISDYHIFVIDSTKNYKLTHFQLSKSEMSDEVKLCGATSAHGTKEASLSNKNIEYAIHFNWNEKDCIYKRWVEKYKQDTNLGIQ